MQVLSVVLTTNAGRNQAAPSIMYSSRSARLPARRLSPPTVPCVTSPILFGGPLDHRRPRALWRRLGRRPYAKPITPSARLPRRSASPSDSGGRLADRAPSVTLRDFFSCAARPQKLSPYTQVRPLAHPSAANPPKWIQQHLSSFLQLRNRMHLPRAATPTSPRHDRLGTPRKAAGRGVRSLCGRIGSYFGRCWTASRPGLGSSRRVLLRAARAWLPTRLLGCPRGSLRWDPVLETWAAGPAAQASPPRRACLGPSGSRGFVCPTLPRKRRS